MTYTFVERAATGEWAPIGLAAGLDRFVAAWRVAHPRDHFPPSEILGVYGPAADDLRDLWERRRRPQPARVDIRPRKRPDGSPRFTIGTVVRNSWEHNPRWWQAAYLHAVRVLADAREKGTVGFTSGGVQWAWTTYEDGVWHGPSIPFLKGAYPERCGVADSKVRYGPVVCVGRDDPREWVDEDLRGFFRVAEYRVPALLLLSDAAHAAVMDTDRAAGSLAASEVLRAIVQGAPDVLDIARRWWRDIVVHGLQPYWML